MIRRTLVCCIPLLLAACANPVTMVPLPRIADPGQAAEVTMIRPRSFIADDFAFFVTVGGEAVGEIRNGERTSFRLPPGRQSIGVRCPGSYAAAARDTKIEYDFRPATPAYFIVVPEKDCVTITPVDAKTAAASIGNTRVRPFVDAPPSAAVALAPAAGAPAAAPASPQVSSATEQVARATGAWVEAFNSRDPKRIVALYDAEAVLWGTTAQRIAQGPAEIAEYFKDAPQRPTNRVDLGEQRIRVYGDIATNSGSYTFSQLRDGKTLATPARFTMVFRNRDGRWTLVEHHSSRVPVP